MQQALSFLWQYSGEIFCDDETDHAMAKIEVAPLPSEVRNVWLESVETTFDLAYLIKPAGDFAQSGGRTGVRHTEHLGHLLATMQILQRSYPGANW